MTEDMKRDVFLAILALDSYNQGYNAQVKHGNYGDSLLNALNRTRRCANSGSLTPNHQYQPQGLRQCS